MPTAILLNPADPNFNFEQMMSHRRYFAAMAPLTRFSALPYLLDPSYDTDIRASMWHLDHQKAHRDFATTLPSNYNADTIGISTAQPIADYDLSRPEGLSWWTFAQFREHYLADGAILPQTTGTFPAW